MTVWFWLAITFAVVGVIFFLLSTLNYVVWWCFGHWWGSNNLPWKCLGWNSWYLLFLRKCFLTSLMNSLPVFFFTFWLYGGLNHIIFLFLLLRAFSVLLLLKAIDEKSPQSFSAVSQTSLLQFPYYRINLNISSWLF